MSWRAVLRVLFIIFIWWGALSLYSSSLLQNHALNPSFPYYNLLTSQGTREQAVWGHFDGTHYLKLAQAGYLDQGTQAFFPVYPLLIKILKQATGFSYLQSGILVSLIALYCSLLLIKKLFGKAATTIIFLLLIFPTSFFLSSVYSESVFLFLTLLFFFLLGKKQFFLSALVAGIASGTRLAGAILVISLIITMLPMIKLKKQYLCLIPLALSGLLSYMYFLFIKFDDPLAFIHVQSMFGAGRSGGEIILLPQVFWRYLQIFITGDIFSWVTQRAILEFISLIGVSILLFRKLKTLNPAVMIYLALSLILPTLSGTLSSFPRYILVLLPWLIPNNLPPKTLFILTLLSLSLLVLFFRLFTLGVFVS